MGVPVDQALLTICLLVNAIVHGQHDDARYPEAHGGADDGVGLVHFEFAYLQVREISVDVSESLKLISVIDAHKSQ